MHTPDSLHEALKSLQIPHEVHHHAAVFTVEESAGILNHLQGAHIKNLFVKDKARNLYLITALEDRSLSLKAIGKHLGSKDNLSFADAETLYEHLGVTPGSVTPLALINAKPGSLRFILDSGIMQHSLVYPHMLTNTQTAGMPPAALNSAIESWGHTIEHLDLSLFPRT
jgi:Ala-tRNA(Pro) deacylase